MKKKNIMKIIMVSFLILFLAFYCDLTFSTSSVINNGIHPILNADPFIVIDDDSDFSSYPGYGNETHPYIIEGFDIEAQTSDDVGINITGTTMHFEIRNNDITAAVLVEGGIGIYVSNIAPNTAKIINNRVRSYRTIMYVEEAEGVIIKDNTCRRIGVTGIDIEHSPFATVENNALYELNPPETKGSETFIDALDAGEPDKYFAIYLENSSDSNITANYVDLDANTVIAGAGIVVFSSDRIIIEDNIVRNIRIDIGTYEYLEKGGLYLEDVSYATIFNNTVEQTDKCNVVATTCDNLVISNNTFGVSQSYGIVFTTTSNSNITYNVIQDHPSFGVDISSGSENNTIHHNHFIDNNDGGSQARDSGTNNIWWDINTSEGNWWNDWTGGNYDISGTAASVDPFPLGDPIIVPEFSKQIIVLLLLMSTSIAVVPFIRKRKNN